MIFLINKNGFTFVETMVALTIFAFVMAVASLVYVKDYYNYAENNQKIEVQENLRFALNRMVRDIRQATVSLDVYDAGGNPSITGPKIKFLSSTGEVIEYGYDDSDKEIEVKRDAGSPQPITSGTIKKLDFQRNENSEVITITVVGKKIYSGEIVLSTKVHLRVQ